MKLYIKGRHSNINAMADYDEETKDFTVLKGSILSETISQSEKFRGTSSIIKSRHGVMSGNVLNRDVHFKSASTAANFVTGNSTNGLTAWKDETGKTFKQILEEIEANA